MPHRDRSINFHRLFVRLFYQFPVLFFLGQRNPLNAQMSFWIFNKASLGIIIIFILAIRFIKSINNCINLKNMIKFLLRERLLYEKHRCFLWDAGVVFMLW